MRRMQAAGIDAFGGELRMLELAAPLSPAPDEVVISVHAAGVANWDEFVRVGDWDVGRRPPLALGVEAAGVVAAVGEDVTSLAPGDQVLTHPVPLRHQGAWAQWLLAPAALVARKPAVVGWEQAAAFPVPALTADQASAAGSYCLPSGKTALALRPPLGRTRFSYLGRSRTSSRGRESSSRSAARTSSKAFRASGSFTL